MCHHIKVSYCAECELHRVVQSYNNSKDHGIQQQRESKVSLVSIALSCKNMLHAPLVIKREEKSVSNHEADEKSTPRSNETAKNQFNLN